MAAGEQKIPEELQSLINQGIADVGDVFRRVAMSAMQYGAETTRTAITEAINGMIKTNEDYLVSTVELESVKEAARDAGVIPPGEHGAVAQAVRTALRALHRASPDGVSVPSMLLFIHNALHLEEISDAQVRNTLKGMIKSDQVEIASRGMYRPGRKLLKLFGEAAMTGHGAP